MADSTPFTASPSDTPGAKLNEIVTDGNWLWWFTASEVDVRSKRANVLSGTVAGGRPHIDVLQRFGALPEARFNLHHHVILV